MRRIGNVRRERRQAEVCDFQVIGEFKDNPEQLLLVCGDGQWYAYDLLQGDIAPIDPNDAGTVVVIDNGGNRVSLDRDRLAS